LIENKQNIFAPFVQVVLQDETHGETNANIHGKQAKDIEGPE